MKYLPNILITFLVVFLIISGCSDAGTSSEVNEPHVVKSGKSVTFTGIDATKEMIKVLEKDLAENPKSKRGYKISSGTEITRQQLLKNLKKLDSEPNNKNSNSNRTIQSVNCWCSSAITFYGGSPPEPRQLQLHTLSDTEQYYFITHIQEYKILDPTHGYEIGSGDFENEGGYLTKYYNRNDVYVSGSEVDATLESTHEFLYESSINSYATGSG